MQKNTPDILKKIIKRKFEEVTIEKKNISLIQIKKAALAIKTKSNFYNNLKIIIDKKQNAVIAEIKKASPSKGILRKNFNPTQIAKDYQIAGATCISVLTDKDFFQGNNDYLKQIKKIVDLPILRKDFIIDEYQIYETKVLGADCILLIAAVLEFNQMDKFIKIAKNINLDVLVEVHNADELTKTLKLDLVMIGINNRNLKTFAVNLNTTFKLQQNIKDKLIITESGILTNYDVKLMNNNGIYGFLVGEALMTKKNIIQTFTKLFN